MPDPRDADWYRVDRMARHIISIGWDSGQSKVCVVQFHKSSIFVYFPFHPDMPGLLTHGVVPVGKEVKVDIAANGAVTSHKVKYSHHMDGNAHFSQDGKIRTAVRGKAADLRTSADHIFSIDVEGLSKFAAFKADDYYGGRYGRGYFEFQGPKPEAVHVVGWWVLARPGVDVAAKTSLFHVPELGIDGIAMAPPPGSALEPGFLVVEVSPRERLTSHQPFFLLFTGGFESGLADPTLESAFLGMKYPAEEAEGLPSVDL